MTQHEIRQQLYMSARMASQHSIISTQHLPLKGEACVECENIYRTAKRFLSSSSRNNRDLLFVCIDMCGKRAAICEKSGSPSCRDYAQKLRAFEKEGRTSILLNKLF